MSTVSTIRFRKFEGKEPPVQIGWPAIPRQTPSDFEGDDFESRLFKQ